MKTECVTIIAGETGDGKSKTLAELRKSPGGTQRHLNILEEPVEHDFVELVRGTKG
jgi:Tfp pilus assembly pilus retraction ATPase PilT